MLSLINRKILHAICIWLLLASVNTYSQSISNLETKLHELNNQYSRESGALDSLKRVFDIRAKQIDSEKKKTNYDESGIRKLMSGSITISNKIDEQQKKINFISKEIEKTKHLLDNKYSVVIDSLSELERSGKYEGNKSELNSRILRLTEKKILMAPKVYSLSFDPEKILSLNPAVAKTAEEKTIYNEYLNNALAEVNSKLKQVKNLNEEVSGIVSLQKKTKKFLEEVEFGSNIDRTAITLRSQGNPRGASPQSGFYDGGDKVSVEENSLSPQIQTYIFILKQLDVASTFKTVDKFSTESGKSNISLEEYAELLDEVEKRLTEYQSILSNKAGSRK